MATASYNGVYLSRPWLTVLSYSGGTGSHAILEMILLGEIPRPKIFVVTNADTGMESSETYRLIEETKPRLEAAGIPFLQTKRNLYEEILALKASGATRFDTPPFWTKNRETGKIGRLMQGCTQVYKIAEMDRALRLWMRKNIGVSEKTKSLGQDAVVKMIGFTHDEWYRIKEAPQEYVSFAYPLIDLKINRSKLAGWYLSRGIKMPARSVCNGCYANDTKYFKEMHANRPHDWEQAVNVDEAIRDLTQIGVRDWCFVSSTCIPLRELAERGFVVDGVEERDMKCHSGHCFV
jgi:hypothetical protein